jgi:hypothetical protein
VTRRITPLQLAAAQLSNATDVEHLTNHEPSWWLRARLVDIEVRSMSGRLKTCGHRTNAPWVISLWDDQHAWCVPCAAMQLKLEGDEAYTCDRCGVVERPIHVAAIAAQSSVVMLGLCAACNKREVAA